MSEKIARRIMKQVHLSIASDLDIGTEEMRYRKAVYRGLIKTLEEEYGSVYAQLEVAKKALEKMNARGGFVGLYAREALSEIENIHKWGTRTSSDILEKSKIVEKPVRILDL